MVGSLQNKEINKNINKNCTSTDHSEIMTINS